jgi:hypothetical protein
MTKVFLDAATQARLNNLGELLEVCDESGKVRGYFHPIGEAAASAGSHQSPHSREELERRRQQRTGRPLSEILARLEQS